MSSPARLGSRQAELKGFSLGDMSASHLPLDFATWLVHCCLLVAEGGNWQLRGEPLLEEAVLLSTELYRTVPLQARVQQWT